MRLNRIALVLPALLLLLLLAAGCQPIVDTRIATSTAEAVATSATPAPEATAAPVATPAPPAPAMTRVLRVGVDIGFPPFAYLDGDGRLVGFEIDLMNALTSLGDFEVAYVPTVFQQLLPGLRAGDFEVAMGAITVNEQRRESVDFTTPYFGQGFSPVSYFSAGQGLALPVDSTLTVETIGPEQRIGVKRFTTGERWAAENLDAQLVAFITAADAFDALEAGELDGVVIDIAVIAGFLRAGELSDVRLGGGPFTEEEYAMALLKGGEASAETLAVLNGALKAAEGPLFDGLVERWFGGP